mmetsp:Transcript_80240/g.259229  ORF Transcript_80240/g.259229 Transcript_80240/m.259229 type:complete len:276 (+) Transcript_80240:1306-2133(+)
MPHFEQHLRLKSGNPSVLDLAADDIHEPIRRVLVPRHCETQVLKIFLGSTCIAQVNSLTAFAQEQHVIKQREERVARLMNHHDARHAQTAQCLQRQCHGNRARRVQPRGGLVQKKQSGLGGKLQAYVDSLPLPSADASLLDTAHDRVLDVVDMHDVQHVVDDMCDPFLRGADIVSQPCGKENLLSDGQVLKDNVVLRDEACHAPKFGNRGLLSVNSDGTDHRAIVHLPTESVQECRLACARGSHNRTHLARPEVAGDSLKDPLSIFQLQTQILEL